MNFWEGAMGWPLKVDWCCEICGQYEGLTWGMVHGTCRCDMCHTQYRMRNKGGHVVTTPICDMKSEYYIPAKKLWDKLKVPLDEIPDSEWDKQK